MDAETKAKLEEVLNRKAELEAATLIQEQERNAAAQKKEAERLAIRQRWTESVSEIDGAISAVNAQIVGTNMILSATENTRKANHPGLAQLFITLIENDQPKERKLVFNVSALGLVQPVVLIPHSGPKISDFRIQEANQAKYEAVLVEFLDHCFAIRKAK